MPDSGHPYIKVAVSACLLGEHVRYDGGHKHNPDITEILGAYFTLVPFCPEVECGLSVPRETMRLEGDPAAPRLMTIQTRVDKTEQMLSYCERKVLEFQEHNISGVIFKERSPSCALNAAPLYGSNSSEISAPGLFAGEVVKHFPFMPVEEAERLNSPEIREEFINRIFQYCNT